jgi:DNA-binding NtrC family response regulator
VSDDTLRELEAQAAWKAVSAAFSAFGRAFVCADSDFRVIHASNAVDSLLGPGASEAVEGRPLADLLGPELFGPAGEMRHALAQQETREGWRAHLRLDDREHRLVSLSAAPFVHPTDGPCDPRVKYVVIVRPAEDDRGDPGAPTAVGGIVARSRALARVFALIENLRQSDATVLISGESGTGKELVARAIHEHSPRRNGPFVAVNGGALPSELLESEMFGHVRGAFTGAVRDRIGRFDMASDGTLFLDEVGDLPLPLQVKLLRVLQDGTYQRVGESQTRVSHARVIAATHVDLPRAVQEGRFRDDLYYRLRVVPLEIPPLRDRREDIEPIARTVLARVGARQGRALRLSPDALRALLQYHWPGNVRELENAIEYAVAVCRGQTILPEDLPEFAAAHAHRTATAAPDAAPDSAPGEVRLRRARRRADEELRTALDALHWRRDAVARALGISRTTLWRRMRAAGLR